MPTPLPEEDSLRYWHPQRFGVDRGPADFNAKLRQCFGDEVAVTWHPLRARWIGWAKSQRLTQTKQCGWQLLFVVETSWGDGLPLDNRTIAAFASQSRRLNGSARQYWDRIEAEIQRDHEKRSQHKRDDLHDWSHEMWQHWKPQISMRGPSNGSKMANHDSRMA
jgi:hypothetical protein